MSTALTDEIKGEAMEALRSDLETRGATGWQNINSVPHGRSVLIFFRNRFGKGLFVKAMFVPKHTFFDDSDDYEFADYCEETEMYFWPEGWYEDVCAETGLDYSFHSLGDIKPTHWMLPGEPEEE